MKLLRLDIDKIIAREKKMGALQQPLTSDQAEKRKIGGGVSRMERGGVWTAASRRKLSHRNRLYP